MNKKKLLLIIVLYLGLLIIPKTFSLYSTAAIADADIVVARFQPMLNGSTNLKQSINLRNTITDDNYTNPYLVPGTSGQITLNLDFKKADISSDYSIYINATNLPKNLKFYTDDSYQNEFLSFSGFYDINSTTTFTHNLYWYWEEKTDAESIANDNLYSNKDLEVRVIAVMDKKVVADYDDQTNQVTNLNVKEADFLTDSWDDIITAYTVGKTEKLRQAMISGSTRNIPLDLDEDGNTDETCALRITNISTPKECKTAGFSQTACGLVLECSNIIFQKENDNSSNWPSDSLRTKLNDETANSQSVYNALPFDLRSKIINTSVVSGGTNSNFTSEDKLYLLSAKEIWGNGIFTEEDEAKDLSRQLDYYSYNGVNSGYTSQSIKRFEGTEEFWQLRTIEKNAAVYYLVAPNGEKSNVSRNYLGVSPAFRIASK